MILAEVPTLVAGCLLVYDTSRGSHTSCRMFSCTDYHQYRLSSKSWPGLLRVYSFYRQKAYASVTTEVIMESFKVLGITESTDSSEDSL